jgi:ABC-type branched-subunit amino acid transport system substrate-binding protein
MLARSRVCAVVVCLAVLTGCPRRFDSRADPIPASTDPAIEREYREARARVEAGDHAGAAARYATFAAQHPQDPLARSARIGEARARIELGELRKAKELLEPLAAPAGSDPLADPVAGRAQYLLGAALVRSGDHARGRELLQRFRNVPATTEDQIELHALFAAAALGLNEPAEALVELEKFHAGARPAERRYIVTRAAEAATRLPAAEVDRLWQGPREALITAFVGPRAADARRQAGDAAGAQRIDEDVLGARQKLGLDERRVSISSPRRLKGAVGCVLPLSGKGKVLGERALRGALLGAELMGIGGGQGALVLEVRDTASDPLRARAAIEELGQAGVMAVIGPPDRAGATEAATAAGGAGMPLFALGPDDGRPSPTLFRMARPRADAARLAARILGEERLTRVAILGPDGASGRELARAFADAARTRGITVVAEVRFGESATSFVREVKQLEAARPQAIFLPATAAQLDLIAPQLASSGLVAMANLPRTGKEARLVATADGLSTKNLVRSGKYLQGALLLPPYWPETADPRAAAFVERYREAYGEEPSVLDALAFDAIRAVRLQLSQGGEPDGWADVAAGLRKLDATGLTGALGFAPDGARTGEPEAWIVEGNGLKRR